MADHTHPLREAFRTQAKACASLGSPFMARLCTTLSQALHPGTPLTDRLFDWPGNLGPSGHSLPLRLCGALHALCLGGNADLAALYPPNNPSDAAFTKGIRDVIRTQSDAIDTWIDTPPQTNEVRRSATLIAAAHWLNSRFDLPFRLSELGASAGLNLHFDRYALSIGKTILGPAGSALTLTPDWTGPLPPMPPPQIAQRRGVDIHPLDMAQADDRLRLRAYLWPDQPNRLAPTNAAITLAEPAPDKGDAITWLAPRLAPMAGQLHLIYTTIAWQYFPAANQAQGTELIQQAGAQTTADAPLAWFQMESDGNGPGARLTMRLWPGNHHYDMGRADFHGRWVHWTPPPN
jgi:hypothetical protein